MIKHIKINIEAFDNGFTLNTLTDGTHYQDYKNNTLVYKDLDELEKVMLLFLKQAIIQVAIQNTTEGL